MSEYSLQLLGRVGLSDKSGPISGRAVQRRQLALLAVLGASPREGLSRDKLVGYLWPETAEDKARHILSDCVYVLRRELGEDAVLTPGDLVQLNPDIIEVDVWDFVAALEMEDYGRAVSRYQGTLLDGFHIDGGEFERWLDVERGRLADLYGKALEGLAERAEAAGESGEATGWWKRLVAHDPYNSRVVMRLMRALELAGDPANAVEQASIHERRLREELGVDPPADLRALTAALRQGMSQGEERSPPSSSASAERILYHAAPAVDETSGEPAPAQRPRRLAPEGDRRLIWQVLFLYVAVSSAILVAVQVLGERSGLPAWVFALAVMLVVVGLPIVTATALLQSIPTTAPRSREVAANVALLRRTSIQRLFTWRNVVRGGVAASAVWGAVATVLLVSGDEPARYPSLAVLPFTTLSDTPANEYITDGITGEIITQLAKIPRLRVVSRMSVLRYKGIHDKSLAEIAAELGVRLVLEGSVRYEGSLVRVSAQLVDAGTDRHLWAETYERELTKLLTFQSDVALGIASQLAVALSDELEARIKRRPTSNHQAYVSYLKGRYHLQRLTAADNAKSIDYFKQAIRLDPNFASAHARLAGSYFWRATGFSDVAPRHAFRLAEASVQRALEIEPDNGYAHLVQALVRERFHFDWSGAERDYRRALELSPGASAVRQAYAFHLAAVGRLAESEARMKEARALDPVSTIARSNQAAPFYFGRKYDQAIEISQEVLETDRDFPIARWSLGRSYIQKGMYAEAIAELTRAVSQAELPQFVVGRLGYAYAALGRRTDALRLLDELDGLAEHRYVSPSARAAIHLGLGEIDRVFELLGQAIEDRTVDAHILNADPFWDPLRPDPRFAELLRRINLPR